MPNFPTVLIEEGNAFPAPAASTGSGATLMGVFLRGLFGQGAPADLGKQSIGTGATAITLSPATPFGVYIRNVSATASVQVTWTPTAGASAIVATLAPGGFIVFANPVAGAAVVTATPGITALTLQASAAATPVEVVTIG